jgi:hypothetical protein
VNLKLVRFVDVRSGDTTGKTTGQVHDTRKSCSQGYPFRCVELISTCAEEISDGISGMKNGCPVFQNGYLFWTSA